MNAVEQQLTGWRAVLWPIHKFETKKFLPMAFMFFCILFNYSMLRSIKDSLVVTSLGAEVIPTIKLWFVLPSAMLFMLVYSKLVNIFKKDTVFYIITLFFVTYFALFMTVLYPFHQYLQFDVSNVSIPLIGGLLKPIGSWVFSSFYVMAELWGSAMIGLMFWRFANDVTSIKESKRFYAMFGFIANGALIATGLVLKSLNSSEAHSSSTSWNALPYLMMVIVISGLCVVALYYRLNNYILKDPLYYNPNEIKKPKKKEKLSLTESFKYILKSKYLGYIALLVICYGISINLVEVVWKGQASLLYPTKAAYGAFMGNLQLLTGICTIICMLIGTNILRRCSWLTGALMTPIMIILTGLIFFGFIIFKDSLSAPLAGLGLTVLGVIVGVGLVQNFLSKGIKYSLFDPTKEMSYIPLDDELKSKGKAVVDVIGGRAGKSGGSLILYVLLNIIFAGSSLLSLAGVVASVFIVIVLFWITAVFGLNKQFLQLTSSSNN
ncbi:MAG: NTP/NDP exchange transporter [Endomicrobium sp.]|jgi:AAA family ATP:ADP antiporter|uniref:Npt1/Npt2 family nucleotide transporter n=1 Tax=Candidatus Endomicrobiellum cubanum TaxID=3242325 RepID=UPI0028399872|nr:NTP/NDP exchange transporter [Endomicrobium sp.]